MSTVSGINENIEYKKHKNENRVELSIKTNEKIPPGFYSEAA